MTFRRTDAGLSNLHRFLRVDWVVFVEGGESTYSLEELEQGSYNPRSEDLKYWRIVFTTFTVGQAFNFRAVGSKSTTKEIASLILGGRVAHVLVAMDRDFDHLKGSLPRGPGGFSTFGYSWENDVWTGQVVLATFRRFNTSPEAEPEAQNVIDREFAGFRAKLRSCVRADAVLSVNLLDPLPRPEFAKVIRPVGGGAPRVDSSAAKSLVRGRRQKIRPTRVIAPNLTLTTLKDCYGHLLENCGYHLLVHLLAKFCKFRTTPRELLVPAAIDAFGEQLRADPDLNAHYIPMFAAVPWQSGESDAVVAD